MTDLAQINEDTHKGWALGSQRFKDAIEKLANKHALSKRLDDRRKLKVVPVHIFVY